MEGEKFTLMQYSVSAILGLIEAQQFVIPEVHIARFTEITFGPMDQKWSYFNVHF